MAIGMGVDAAALDLDLDLHADPETPRVLPRTAVEALRALDAAALADVVAAAARTMAAREGDKDAAPLTTVDVDVHREAFAAAACVLVRCARESGGGLDAPTPLRQVVAACGVDDEALLARLLPHLETHAPRLRHALAATSFDLAHIVDVAWRLDHVLCSSSAGNVHEPLYCVELKVQPPQGAVRDVQFACSAEGLRDLVFRLQDATNSIEKIASAVTASRATARNAAMI